MTLIRVSLCPLAVTRLLTMLPSSLSDSNLVSQGMVIAARASGDDQSLTWIAQTWEPQSCYTSPASSCSRISRLPAGLLIIHAKPLITCL